MSRTVTIEQIEAEITSEHFFTADCGVVGQTLKNNIHATAVPCPPCLALLTFCVLVLRNGFTVTGQSACADPATFDAQKGREIARADAIRQCWALLGFRLRDEIAAGNGSAPAVKRYTREDFDVDSLKWATEAPHENPFQDRVAYVVNMRGGDQVRGFVRLTDIGDAWTVGMVSEACLRDALVVANGIGVMAGSTTGLSR